MTTELVELADRLEALSGQMYLDDDAENGSTLWFHANELTLITEQLRALASRAGGSDALDARRFRRLLDLVMWANAGDGHIKWVFYLPMPEPDISAEMLGPDTVRNALIAAIDANTPPTAAAPEPGAVGS